MPITFLKKIDCIYTYSLVTKWFFSTYGYYIRKGLKFTVMDTIYELLQPLSK